MLAFCCCSPVALLAKLHRRLLSPPRRWLVCQAYMLLLSRTTCWPSAPLVRPRIIVGRPVCKALVSNQHHRPTFSRAPASPNVLGGPDLSTAGPSQVPADGPSTSRSQPASSSMEYYKIDKRPYGSLRKNPALKAEADREKQKRYMQRIKDGVLKDKLKPDGSPYAAPSFEEYQARRRARYKQRMSSLTEEARVKMNQEKNERSREAKARRKAQQKAQEEGRTWQGSPVQPLGRPEQNWGQEHVGPGSEEVPQHVLADARMEEATPHRAPPSRPCPARLRSRKEAAAAGSSSLTPFAFFPEAPPQRFAPGTSLSQQDPGLSLSAPSSSSIRQRQTAPAQPAARTRGEDWLRLALAPPGQEDPSDENDRLRLTLAPPRHD